MEYVLMGSNQDHFTFANDAKILADPNVFIRDAGATSDTTNYRYDFINIREAMKKDSTGSFWSTLLQYGHLGK
eukprot:1244518-Ditylum_brightwellii.AAC.1